MLPWRTLPVQSRLGLAVLFNQQEMVLAVAFVLVLIGVTLLNPGFIAPGNLIDILYNSSYIGWPLSE